MVFYIRVPLPFCRGLRQGIPFRWTPSPDVKPGGAFKRRSRLGSFSELFVRGLVHSPLFSLDVLVGSPPLHSPSPTRYEVILFFFLWSPFSHPVTFPTLTFSAFSCP